ncbi:AGC family protein kinase [Trichomonas vaginalis G3]|uniref:non-specific serine/threonine protein kinase n=1 Tax=Trichomonas vaginalis (strain ATCC PRA-98 / G3) TaxID=412133 RepID=A2GEQ5_TRIV3|nr:STKc MAST like domain-containing protein [Trichomonas vaginalis G3]EAX84361.1 AGC family protein kinase [Trichomonas vaginalis G3]KAI5531498.1 STKc MAST like domain-containing protein [Trichomonas vaginalis G3]|eukprot:XP_001297291.1 AGC family protein kinase [Trichomonas vaginalis G3]
MIDNRGTFGQANVFGLSTHGFKLPRNSLQPVKSELLPTVKKLQPGGKYVRPYFNLRAQSILLTQFNEALEKPIKEETPEEFEQRKTIQKFIRMLLNAHLGSILEVSYQVTTELTSFLSKNQIFPSISRAASILLKAALSIRKISNYLDAKTKEDNEIIPCHSENDMNEILLKNPAKDNCIICRICNELVQSDDIENHMIYCVKGYKSEECRNRIYNEIKCFINEVDNKLLHIPWPASQNEMIDHYLPLLHASATLKHILELNLTDQNSKEELSRRKLALKRIHCDKPALEIVKRAIFLVKECVRVNNAIKIAMNGLKATRASRKGSITSNSKITIADFEFVKRISSGAFATVFIAKKKLTGDIYAIKAIPKTVFQQKNQTSRILKERDILLEISNPYVVTFYYSIISDKNLYLVTEFVPGGDLYSVLQMFGAFDEESAKIYLYQILQALKYIHGNGIIHRDLKPDNILVTAEGTLKLTDFGLSSQGCVNRQVNQEIEEADTCEIVGTLDYMAPEVLLNQPHTFAVDFWSLGCMLFEFLTGVPPFHAETEEETTQNILTSKVEFYEEDEITNEARDLIIRLLEPNPEKRLGSKSIDEIFNHPWLKNVDTSDPPFVPQRLDATDTRFFEERYRLSPVEDKDILHDMELAKEGKCSNDRLDLAGFQTLSVENLMEQNLSEVRKIKKANSTPNDSPLLLKEVVPFPDESIIQSD